MPLPNGYRLVRTNAVSIFVFPPESAHHSVFDGDWAVPAKIVGIQVSGDIVYGKTVSSPDADPGRHHTRTGPAGFFILDTATHTVQLGLNEDAWRATLRARGITDLNLKKPSRFFK